MNLPAYIGIRFSVSQKDSAFLSFITRVSMIGLTLGVVALIVVVSVMNGFDSQLKYRILGAVPHMVVHGELPTTPINGVLASAPFLKRDGMLVQSNKNRLVAVYGIDPGKEKEMSVVPSHMVEGRLEDLVPGSYKIAIGKPLGLQLGLWTGDNITLLIPEPSPQEKKRTSDGF